MPKKYDAALGLTDREKKITVEEALNLVGKTGFAKFDESVDIAVRLGVNPKHADQMVRGACVMPSGTGKVTRVLVFAKGDKVKEAQDAGADFVGAEDLAEKIKTGWFEFDKAIATPDMMGLVGKLGKLLGTRGLMPNPKVGTVTMDVGKAVRESKAGKVEFRVDKNGIIHHEIRVVVYKLGAVDRAEQHQRQHQQRQPPPPKFRPYHAPPVSGKPRLGQARKPAFREKHLRLWSFASIVRVLA